MPGTYYYDPSVSNWAISGVSACVIRTVDPVDVASRRRSNYLRLRKRLEAVKGVAPLLPDLPERVCPLGFPVLVEDRARWLRQLDAHHICAYPWWGGYHRALNFDKFPEICALKDKVLMIPVHQELDEAQIDFVAETVVDLSEQRESRAGATAIEGPLQVVVS